MQNKEEFIEELSYHLSSNASEVKTPTKRKSLTRRFYTKVGAPGVALIICSSLVLGVLGGYFFTQLEINMSGTVVTNGQTVQSIFLWDGEMLTDEVTEIPCDITEIAAGQTITIEHTVTNADNGYWWCTVDTSGMDYIFNNPLDPFYGFNVSIEPAQFLIGPTETQQMTWTYYLHHEFLDPQVFGYNETNNMPFDVTFNIEMLPPPEAIDDPDSGTVHYSEHLTVYPLLNDLPEFEADLNLFTIESITPGEGIASNPAVWILSINPDGKSIDIYYAGSPSGTFDLDYTMSDPIGATSTATVTFTAVGNG